MFLMLWWIFILNLTKGNKNKIVTTIKPAEKIYKNPYKEIAKNTAKIAGALAAINTISGLAATASRRMS